MKMLLLVEWLGWDERPARAAQSATRKGRGNSAATTTTTATTRGAAQINCAALGEQKLKAG
jgi:hypothetical protein